MRDGAEHLAWLGTRRSVRRFAARRVAREVLERLVAAATTAPSSSNRQPWRFTVVTAPGRRRAIAAAVRARAAELGTVVACSPHAAEYAGYGDFFHEPLESAAAIVVPQARVHEDLIAALVASGGGDPAAFTTPAAMQPELASASAAVMLLLLQAHAEGLGACWMAGPTIARAEVERLCRVTAPWRMLGAVAVGHLPEDPLPPKPPRRPLARVADFIEEDTPCPPDPALEERVRQLVAEALARPLADLPAEAAVVDDLGGESLDLLDLVFRIERAFGVEITRGEMERAARGEMTDDEFAPAGVVSEAGLERLRSLMPEAAARIHPGLRPFEIPRLFSAPTFARMVAAKRPG